MTNWYEDRFNQLNWKLDWIIKSLQFISRQESKEMATLEQIIARVADETTEIGSLKVFVQGLRQQILDALSGATLPPATQAKIDAVFTGVDKNATDIVDAMAESVPPPPPPPADTVPAGG